MDKATDHLTQWPPDPMDACPSGCLQLYRGKTQPAAYVVPAWKAIGGENISQDKFAGCLRACLNDSCKL